MNLAISFWFWINTAAFLLEKSEDRVYGKSEYKVIKSRYDSLDI